MKTFLYRASNLKSTITFLAFNFSGSQFLAPVKNRRYLRFIHNQLRHSLCRVGTHCSTHQYKLPVNFFANPTSGGSL